MYQEDKMNLINIQNKKLPQLRHYQLTKKNWRRIIWKNLFI